MMKYHDYHLYGYEVDSRGGKITLHLMYDYPGIPKEEAYIEFTSVVLYNFTHTAGAIITDIEEVAVPELLSEIVGSVSIWATRQGVDGWGKSPEHYRAFLEAGHYKAWHIDSAIGFSGFVIAKSVSQLNG
jgi:hypothetical protein